MRDMKRFRVAIVTMGSALLLGPGLALSAKTIIDPKSLAPPVSSYFATETLGVERTIQSKKYYDLVAAGTAIAERQATDPAGAAPAVPLVMLEIAVNADLDPAEENYYFRIALDGMVFHTQPVVEHFAVAADGTIPASGTALTPRGSAENNNVLVVRLPSGTTADPNDLLRVNLNNHLAVSSQDPNAYSVSVGLYRDQFDADDGVNRIGTRSVGGEAVLVRTVSGLEAAIENGYATAGVDFGYLWFKTADGSATAEAALGNLNVTNRTQAHGVMVLDARDSEEGSGSETAEGELFDASDVVDAQNGGVIATVVGDLSIGAFDLFDSATGCSFDTVSASPESPLMGIEDSDNKPAPGTKAGLAVNMAYTLCLNVDVEGAETNASPIEAQSFDAAVSIVPTTNTKWGDAQSAMIGSGTIGTIRRDGTHRRVTYLTASDKYNQRLIIVNHSGKMVHYDLVGITTEDGTTVELSEAAMAAKEAGLNTIMPRSQVVLRVGDILNFQGKNRAAATVAVNSNPSNISVATTQVNLEDGSTDTVIY